MIEKLTQLLGRAPSVPPELARARAKRAIEAALRDDPPGERMSRTQAIRLTHRVIAALEALGHRF